MTMPASPPSPSPEPGESFAKFPHSVIGVLPRDALLLYAVLQQLDRGQRRWMRVSHAEIQMRTGWAASGATPAALTKRTSRAVAALVQAGLVERRTNHLASLHLSVPLTRVLEPPAGRFEVLPRTLLRVFTDVARQGEGSTLLHTYLAYLFLMGGRRRTDAPLAEVRAITRAGDKTTPAMLHQLVDLGLVHLEPRDGATYLVCLDPIPVTTLPGADADTSAEKPNTTAVPAGVDDPNHDPFPAPDVPAGTAVDAAPEPPVLVSTHPRS